MDYSYDQFNALVMEVQAQGGARLNDTCEGEMIPYEIAKKPSPVMSCHCSNEALFAFPYEGGPRPDKPDQRDKNGLVRACAVCDGLGWMPRFKESVDA